MSADYDYIFLGLQAQINREYVTDLIVNTLPPVVSSGDTTDLANSIASLDGWTDPKDYHVTLYYGGGRPEAERRERKDAFPEGKKVKLKLKYLVYAVGFNVCVYARILDPRTQSDNRFSHITLKTRHSAAVDSNALLEALYQEDYDVFNNGGANLYLVSLKGKSLKCYVVALDEQEVIVNSVATVYYKY